MYFCLMYKLVIIGAGNVATHLFNAFQQAPDIALVQVYNRSEAGLEAFKNRVSTTTSIEEIAPADVYLLSISDDAVEEMVHKLSAKKALIAHTSGSVPLLSIARHNGVFYPLQTFSKSTAVDFSEIPVCVEAEQKEDLKVLQKLGAAISERVYHISTAQRKSLHLSAVFACNFVNHLYRIAEKICHTHKVPFEILQPLIQETAAKIKQDSPKNVQTGPAQRGDESTIDFHLQQLDSPELKEIYTLLTRSIQQEK